MKISTRVANFGERMYALYNSCSYGKKVAVFTVIGILFGAVVGFIVVAVMSTVGVDLKMSVWQGAAIGGFFAFILVYLAVIEHWYTLIRK